MSGSNHSPGLNKLYASQLSELLVRKKIDIQTIAKACLGRVQHREADVQAWAWIDHEAAMEHARFLDQQPRRSVLHGIPIALKDIIDTSEMPTEYGSSIYKGHRPKSDASCVSLLKQAGCLILGKTVTTEFANIEPGKTRNPWNFGHTPGGSSSGSAAAVADCMVPLAIGTQTAGSVIRPAAFCGTYAIKPTFGSIERTGVKPLAESLDTIGLFARHPNDLALLVQLLTGQLPEQKPSRAPKIGFCRTSQWEFADAINRANLESVRDQLEQAGAIIEECALPGEPSLLLDAHSTIMDFESARSLYWEYLKFPNKISSRLTARLEKGQNIPWRDYRDAQRVRLETASNVQRLIAGYDFLLTPAAKGEAPPSLDQTGDSIFNRAWTLLGLPCVAIPFGRGDHDLPLGLQIVGSVYEDMTLLGWAEWVAVVLNRSASSRMRAFEKPESWS